MEIKSGCGAATWQAGRPRQQQYTGENAEFRALVGYLAVRSRLPRVRGLAYACRCMPTKSPDRALPVHPDASKTCTSFPELDACQEEQAAPKEASSWCNCTNGPLEKTERPTVPRGKHPKNVADSSACARDKAWKPISTQQPPPQQHQQQHKQHPEPSRYSLGASLRE